MALGYLIFLGSLLLFLFALGARLGRRGVLQALALAGLVFIAVILAIAGGSTPAIGILHPIDALLVVGFSGLLAHRAWTGRAGANP